MEKTRNLGGCLLVQLCSWLFSFQERHVAWAAVGGRQKKKRKKGPAGLHKRIFSKERSTQIRILHLTICLSATDYFYAHANVEERDEMEEIVNRWEPWARGQKVTMPPSPIAVPKKKRRTRPPLADAIFLRTDFEQKKRKNKQQLKIKNKTKAYVGRKRSVDGGVQASRHQFSKYPAGVRPRLTIQLRYRIGHDRSKEKINSQPLEKNLTQNHGQKPPINIFNRRRTAGVELTLNGCLDVLGYEQFRRNPGLLAAADFIAGRHQGFGGVGDVGWKRTTSRPEARRGEKKRGQA